MLISSKCARLAANKSSACIYSTSSLTDKRQFKYTNLFLNNSERETNRIGYRKNQQYLGAIFTR